MTNDQFGPVGRQIYGPTEPGEAVKCARTSALAAEEIDTIVDLIATARAEHRSLVLPSHLHTRHWDSVMTVMLKLTERLGDDPCGWKIGAASAAVRAAEGVPSAAPGRLFRRTVFSSPAVLDAALFINYRNCECEIAFRLGDDLPARIEEYSEYEVADAVESMLPVIEIGDTVFDDWYGASGYFGSCMDNNGGAALVCGPPVAEWRTIALGGLEVELTINDHPIKRGRSDAAMGSPLTSLVWLVNWLRQRDRGLMANEIVSTGTWTGHCFAARGDQVDARFRDLGVVSCRFE